ncbi:MAG: DUF1553 domain-containing protein [Acidobacteria bacterium]|nr:DUF1553 domain-containing protein [Acidobacteriota bacterium]
MVGFGHSLKQEIKGHRIPGRREDCRVKRQKKVALRALAALVCLLSPLASSAAGSGRLPEELFSPHQRKHWAFQTVQRPKVPAVRHSEWVRTPIDAFVLAELEAGGLEPSPPADGVTLLRRAYFGLIGLPPTPEDVDAFLADPSSKAFETVVDRLLDSPHYGERWTRHWLDLARYADSEGFKSDQTRPNAWRYREYLIRSFNGDKPYDRFVREQIAGDELWSNDPDAGLATAFNRLYPDEHNARNLVQRRQEILHDITSVVGGVFLGLTYECARCHDHKFDPLLQADYYRLQAFFANVRARDDIVLASRETADRHRRRLAVWEQKTAPIRREMAALEEPKRKEILDELISRYPEAIQEAVTSPSEKRTPFQWLMFYKVRAFLDPASYLYHAPTRAVVNKLKDEDKKRWKELKSGLDKFSDLHPGELPIGIGIADAGRQAPPTFILSGGAYDASGEEVEPGFPTLFDPAPAEIVAPKGMESTGRRTALANWIADPDNPLTARVMVNRIWHYHFGRGIVDTPSNLGLSGGMPSHPRLLDWLATEFIRNNWSIKHLHRLILNSNTYRQASLYRVAAAGIDPENKRLWRFPRQRLEGEIIRDAALAVSGLLNPEMGGPSVFPPIPPGMKANWETTQDPAERNRRSLYVFIRRNTRYPMFETFDLPDTHESCPRRDITTSPLQALTMLNSEVVLEWARGFAGRLFFAAGLDPDAQIDMAYRLAYSRHPTSEEMDAALDFLYRQREVIAEDAAEGKELVLPLMRPYNVDPVEAAALVDFCHMIISSNEFTYRN